jgi:moderate conductance mechanosensitive channel
MEQLLDQAWAGLPNYLGVSFRIGLILVLAAVALRAIHLVIPRLREAIAERQKSNEESQRVRTLSRVVRYALTVATLVVAVLLVLCEVGISIAPVLGAAGVVGIAGVEVPFPHIKVVQV